MTMEKRNLIEEVRTPDFAKQASEDELEKTAVDMFKNAATAPQKESDKSAQPKPVTNTPKEA